MNYNDLAKTIYEQNKAVGWWDNPDRCKLTLLQLISTEIAEATEAERKDLMDDHLPHRKGGEVELADAMIRLLDMAGAYGWVYNERQYNIVLFEEIGEHKEIGSLHFFITSCVCSLGSWVDDENEFRDEWYTKSIDAISYTADTQGYDLEGALHEKLAYNAKRADHKRENRAKENGKKF